MSIDKGRVVSWVSRRKADRGDLHDLAELLRKRLVVVEDEQGAFDPSGIDDELLGFSGRIRR